jgi:hypothetical protein
MLRHFLFYFTQGNRVRRFSRIGKIFKLKGIRIKRKVQLMSGRGIE